MKNCITTKNFQMNGKEYFIKLTIENEEIVVKEIVQIMDKSPNGYAKVIYNK